MKHCFVENMPSKNNMKDNMLYISLKYNVAIHKCACGCGNEVITPFHKQKGWILSYDGKHVSLSPSIGNWNLPCQSHYWIKDGDVIFIGGEQKKKKKRNRWFRLFCK